MKGRRHRPPLPVKSGTGDEAGGSWRQNDLLETPVRPLASFLSEGGHLWKILTGGIVGSGFFPFFFFFKYFPFYYYYYLVLICVFIWLH